VSSECEDNKVKVHFHWMMDPDGERSEMTLHNSNSFDDEESVAGLW